MSKKTDFEVEVEHSANYETELIHNILHANSNIKFDIIDIVLQRSILRNFFSVKNYNEQIKLFYCVYLEKVLLCLLKERINKSMNSFIKYILYLLKSIY